MKGPYIPFDYPNDVTPLDVDRPFPIGRSRTDGTAVQINLSKGGGFIVAARNGGGTMMLNNLTASLARMPNALVWHIDFNNGSLSAPWLAEDSSDDDWIGPVDWVATTEDEALRTVHTGLRIAKRRRAAYAADMFRNNQTVLPARPDLPQIVILVDKDSISDSAVGRQLAAALRELRRLGRAIRIVVVGAYYRATVDHMPIDEKQQAQFALVGRVNNQSELAYALDGDKDVNVPQHTGQFVIGEHGGNDEFDAFRLTPHQIRQIATGVADIRAATYLDQASVDAAGDDYLERWFRPEIRQWMAAVRDRGEATPDVDDTEPVGHPNRTSGSGRRTLMPVDHPLDCTCPDCR